MGTLLRTLDVVEQLLSAHHRAAEERIPVAEASRRWRARSIGDRASLVGRSGDEALPLLLTLSSGVKGFTTIHAGSARQALTRLRFICQLADTSSEIPMSALNTLVSEAIDVVVHCSRTGAGLGVSEIICVEELAGGPDATQFTTSEVFRRPGHDQPLAWTGTMPVRAGRVLRDAGHDPRALLAAETWSHAFEGRSAVS